MAAHWGFLALQLAGAACVGYPARAQEGFDAGSHAGSGLAPVPAFHGYVNDEAGVIGEPRVAQLESFLDQLHQKTGAQFAVLTVQTCAPEDPTMFRTRVFNTWGIGDKERSDGLLLLISMQEHALEFETGYGLEGTLPDGRLGRIRDLALPEFRAGRPADGITLAVLAASKFIAAEKGVKLEWDGKELKYDEDGGRPPSWVMMLILFVLFFIVLPALASRSRYRRRRGGYSGWGGGGWGGGFGGFGGGFGGGSFGGGGGGGGGGSFGGFGGGSSGGGGASGRW